jgi:hypothetical protein
MTKEYEPKEKALEHAILFSLMYYSSLRLERLRQTLDVSA